MKFTKMAAAGNDFILIDNRRKNVSGREKDFFRNICRRRYSVGADGVILLEKSSHADILYRHFNSDGLPAGMCGNGARCISLYAYKKKISEKRLSMEAGGEVYQADCRGDFVSVTFPYPLKIEPDKKVFPEFRGREAGFIWVGVPHFVIFTDELDRLDVETEGRKYRCHSKFEKGTNVDFVQILGKKSIKLRTYERGVEAETESCGTGAVASALYAHLLEGLSPPLQVSTRGGILEVQWDPDHKNVSLTGKAEFVYEGRLTLAAAPARE